MSTKTFMAENMKILRKHKGYSQQDLANCLGIKRASIGSYEEGRCEPSIFVIWKLAKMMNVTIEQFIGAKMEEIADEEVKENDKVLIRKIDLVRHLLKDIESRYKIKIGHEEI